ncbi:MAG: hypothetical protein HZA35_00870 [Parcubacteria group bacterium]|nr:hypothetical protein [Parcubacteria group bacterium]
MVTGHMLVTFHIPWNDYVASQGAMEHVGTFLKSYGVLSVRTADSMLIVIGSEGYKESFQTMTFEALLSGSKEDAQVMIDNLFKTGRIPSGREWQVLYRCAGEDDVKSFRGEEV